MKKKNLVSGIRFSKFEKKEQTPFERLFEIFKELITHTSGDFDEAIEWLRELDKEYNLTDEEYSIDDFIEDLKQKAYIQPKLKRDGDGQAAVAIDLK
jgi:3'-phosphoadenosine 5'-phosphosulfate sulfotransferase (PAPS reductase)/FAD synthetase